MADHSNHECQIISMIGCSSRQVCVSTKLGPKDDAWPRLELCKRQAPSVAEYLAKFTIGDLAEMDGPELPLIKKLPLEFEIHFTAPASPQVSSASSPSALVVATSIFSQRLSNLLLIRITTLRSLRSAQIWYRYITECYG